MKTLLFLFMHPFLPLFWMIFAALGSKDNPIEFYKEFVEYYKSDEPFGPLG